MATPLRVHTLAKELGVPSKAIIDKCHAEGIELKNHMATISVGLAESIREWFSTGVDVTSVEDTAPVDLTKTKRPSRKAVARAEPPAEDAVAVAEMPTAAERETGSAVAEAPPPATAPAEVTVAPEPPPVVAPVAAPAPEEPAPPPEEPAAPAIAAEAPPPPPPAEPVRPAGPKLVPKPAELQGPRVVRIEAPEPDRLVRPRPRPGVAVARGPVETTTAPAGPARRGRGKGKKGEEEGESLAVRSRSPRRHGSTTDVDQRLREWRDQDLLERKERLASVTGHGLRERRAAERRRQATTQPGGAAAPQAVEITAPIMLREFCAAVGVPFKVVSKKLMEQTGQLWMINQSVDAEQVELLALELGLTISVARAKTAYERLQEELANRVRKNLQPRPPVVAMLGHVDHGKTSLLDAIRKTRVAAGEAGGITQHIGAYRLDRGDWHVTFIDTPGHEAFTAMRSRGATLTDVVVLVVAADDGVMPQTAEAITHARAAKVPIVVALNKIDLPGADVNRVYAQLSEHGLVPSEWGGDTDVIKTSATTGQGIDELVAHLSTLSDLLELRADPDVPAVAMVIEAQVREGQGIVANVLVREGTLRPQQIIVCGAAAGRVRALRDDRGRTVKEATPGTPVEVSGLDALPESGDLLFVVDQLARAKEIAAEVRVRRREEELDAAPRVRTLESLIAGGGGDAVPELNVIVRADVQGSVEVLKKTLGAFPAEKARLQLLQVAVGAVTEADVQLAKASNAMIIGFNVVPEERARQLADQLGVEIRVYRVIYEILEDLNKALLGLLAPLQREELRGTAEVRQVFHVSRVGTVAGCYVTDGVIQRSHKIRLLRDGRIVVDGGTLGSLKRFKDDAREVRAGLECGIKLEGFDDVKPGDVIQAFELVEVAQKL